ncbi:MAG TPA: phosphoadenylyl-sulfate reductase [Thermoplasmata archaeon]|nr:phosphoadenylyl-sulfate reductase [Thermoplasmata archaeon]
MSAAASPRSSSGPFDDPVRRAAELARQWESLPTPELIRRCATVLPGPWAVGSAFGREGVVLLHLVREVGLDFPVLFLDTGYHFPETLAFRDAVASELGLSVHSLRPEETVAEQDVRLGAYLHDRDPDLCCRLRKVEPLARALAGFSGWFTGIRRDQSPGRSQAPVVEWQPVSADHGVFKVNPLARWTRREIEVYHAEHRLPSHPLWAAGFPSVGCAPCTRAIAPGAPERAGRWAGTGKSECGIHTLGLRVPTRTP